MLVIAAIKVPLVATIGTIGTDKCDCRVVEHQFNELFSFKVARYSFLKFLSSNF